MLVSRPFLGVNRVNLALESDNVCRFTVFPTSAFPPLRRRAGPTRHADAQNPPKLTDVARLVVGQIVGFWPSWVRRFVRFQGRVFNPMMFSWRIGHARPDHAPVGAR